MGLINVPLKSILSFYAQAANHPLPGDLSFGNGATISPGNHGIAGGSSPYILPELRNTFLIGANRASALLDGGQYIAFISNMTASGNSYDYQTIGGNPNYTVQSGDYLSYDVFWPSANIPGSGGGCGAVDLSMTDGTVMRTIGPNDQNGISSNPTSDLRSFALDQWYRRRISLSSYVGKILNGFILAHEYDGTFASLTTRFQNIYITNSTGSVVNYIAWQSGDGTPPSYAVHALNSATFVSGNASTLSAPGPNGTSGSHRRVIKTHHIVSHGHAGSTSGSSGAHAHSTSISAHGSHSHNPSNGSNFVLYNTTARARVGANFFTITCGTATTAGAGNHGHTVSPPNDGSHAHNLTVGLAFSGAVNAAQTPFDPRPRFYGLIHCVKTGTPSARLLSIPMGAVIMWYADTQNETLPLSLSYCDGSSLTSGNHSVPNAAGSLAYTLVLPELRNRYIIGGELTKTFNTAGNANDDPTGAPGSGYSSGVHSLSIGVANLPDHGHTGTTDTQWTAHNHNWTISANGDHVHGPAVGGYNLTSTTGATENQATGGIAIEEAKSDSAAGATTTNDGHSHTFHIFNAGLHSHTVTIASNGSGTTWDNRSPFIGVILLMKTQAGSLISVPLKTIVAMRATTVNETFVSTGEWVACEGQTLTPGQFDMAANSGSNYVVPDFLKFFPLGADRTKTVGNTGALTDVAADAPGPKGTAGAAQTTMTTSTMPAHVHLAGTDTQGDHGHGTDVGTSSDGGHAHSTGCHTSFNTTSGVTHAAGQSTFTSTPPAVNTYSSVLGSATQPGHGTSGDTQGAHTHAVTVNNFGSGSAFQQRPRFHGVVFYMKVKR